MNKLVKKGFIPTDANGNLIPGKVMPNKGLATATTNRLVAKSDAEKAERRAEIRQQKKQQQAQRAFDGTYNALLKLQYR